MSNEELKTGDLVYVSDKSEERAKELKTEAIFIAKINKDLPEADNIFPWLSDGESICHMPESGEFEPWSFAVKVPEPELVPWTYETSPRLPFVLRPVSNPVPHEFVVTEKTTDCLFGSNSKISYTSALNHYQWLDSEEWKPCGVLEE